MMNNFNSRLKQAMELKRISQTELCEQTGIPKSAMSQYVSGAFVPKQERTYLIAKALNVNEAWLMGYDTSMERTPPKNIVFDETPSETPIELNQELVQETLEKLKDVFSNINDIIYDTAASDERYIRYYYSMLNQSGKKEALKRVIELTRIDDYIKNE